MDVQEDCLQDNENCSSHAAIGAVSLKYLGLAVIVILVVALQVNSYSSSKFANHTPFIIYHTCIEFD